MYSCVDQEAIRDQRSACFFKIVALFESKPHVVVCYGVN